MSFGDFISRLDDRMHDRALWRTLADQRHWCKPLCALNHRLRYGKWPQWHDGWIYPEPEPVSTQPEAETTK